MPRFVTITKGSVSARVVDTSAHVWQKYGWTVSDSPLPPRDDIGISYGTGAPTVSTPGPFYLQTPE